MMSWLLILQSDSPTSHVWLKREQATLRESNKAIHWEHLSQSSRCMHTASHSSHHRVGTIFSESRRQQASQALWHAVKLWLLQACQTVTQIWVQTALVNRNMDRLAAPLPHSRSHHVTTRHTIDFDKQKKREDTFIQIHWVKMLHVWCRHWWHGQTTTAR